MKRVLGVRVQNGKAVAESCWRLSAGRVGLRSKRGEGAGKGAAGANQHCGHPSNHFVWSFHALSCYLPAVTVCVLANSASTASLNMAKGCTPSMRFSFTKKTGTP